MSGPDPVDVYQVQATLRNLVTRLEGGREQNAAEVLLASRAVEKVVSYVERFGCHPAVVFPGLQVTRLDPRECSTVQMLFMYLMGTVLFFCRC